jgi:hypothetical protein
MVVYDNGATEILSNAEVLMTEKGGISSLSVDGQPLWERDENIVSVLLPKHMYYLTASETAVMLQYPTILTRAPIIGEKMVVYINDVPYVGQYIDDGGRCFISDSGEVTLRDMGSPVSNFEGRIHMLIFETENPSAFVFSSVAIYATAS